MALVDHQEKILGEIVDEGHGGRAGDSVGDDAGIVLDAGAVAQLLHHFHIIGGALADALGFDELAVVLEPLDPLLHLHADALDGGLQLLPGSDVVGGGVDGRVAEPPLHRAGDHLHLADAVDLVPEELHPDGGVPGIDGEDLQGVPPDAEHIAVEGHVVALIAHLHQLGQDLLPVAGLPLPQGEDHALVVLRVAQAVDAADGGHHNHIPPLEEGGSGAVPQALDLVVDARVLLNEGVRGGDIGLRLIIIVVGHEVFHRVIGEKLLELAAQLGSQDLVVGKDQGGPLGPLDDLCHGIGLAGAGNPQEGLLLQPQLQSSGQSVDGLRLIPGRRILADDLEFRHILSFQQLRLSGGNGRTLPWKYTPPPPR